jgi:two-component system response regulator HydG
LDNPENVSKRRLLIIDDDEDFVDDLCLLLQVDFSCQGVVSGREGLTLLEQKDFDAVLLDIDLGSGINGLEVLDTIAEFEIPPPVIMISKDQSIDTVVSAMKKGAYDYIGKKPDLSELKLIIGRALDEYGLRRDNLVFRDEIKDKCAEIVGNSQAIIEIRNKIERLAGVETTVMISGETGTGKELVARQIHYQSSRTNRPFVVVNCAVIPQDLFESELYGHEKGSFSGAHQRTIGKFERAEKGTIFLDEIGELSGPLQAKLLRVIEEKEIERVGGEETLAVDVRIIAATNRELKKDVEAGRFRSDLFFRLNVSPVEIPPLRERRQDIPILADWYVRRKAMELKKKITGISEKAMDILVSHNWPGNIRELVNTIENAIIYADDAILDEKAFANLLNGFEGYPGYEQAKQAALKNFKRDYILTILRAADGNITHAAQRMDITRQGLQKMMRELGIDPAQFS